LGSTCSGESGFVGSIKLINYDCVGLLEAGMCNRVCTD
jgi:hypothetical protein